VLKERIETRRRVFFSPTKSNFTARMKQKVALHKDMNNSRKTAEKKGSLLEDEVYFRRSLVV
jgi:hypothetical protein